MTDFVVSWDAREVRISQEFHAWAEALPTHSRKLIYWEDKEEEEDEAEICVQEKKPEVFASF